MRLGEKDANQLVDAINSFKWKRSLAFSTSVILQIASTNLRLFALASEKKSAMGPNWSGATPKASTKNLTQDFMLVVLISMISLTCIDHKPCETQTDPAHEYCDETTKVIHGHVALCPAMPLHVTHRNQEIKGRSHQDSMHPRQCKELLNDGLKW